jgi:hypothetical protein
MPSSSSPPTVWQALDEWAATLRVWQRVTLAYAIKGRVLTEAQVDEVYELFLQEAGFKDKQGDPNVAVDVTGRPVDVPTKQMRLEKIDSLAGINALPDGAALTFGPALTVIYGRNGAGKSGFARLFANACFSRHKPSILGNIYQKAAASAPAANFHLTIDGVAQPPLALAMNINHPDLQRVSFFDNSVARQHVSEASPFEFNPSGFDIFPEMARVYGLIGARLDVAIQERTRETKFSESFIGLETPVSRAVASIGASTDIGAIENLAVYGLSEKARFEEVDKQLTALKSKSQKEILASLRQARSDIESLANSVESVGIALGEAKSEARNSLAMKAAETAAFATSAGSDQFKRSFFNAVGSPEWQTFTKAAHALAHKESERYPQAADHCLLCERPFDDEPSRTHVAALLLFVEGEAQRVAEKAVAEVEKELSALQALNTNIFSEGARVREHVHRIDPTVELTVSEFATDTTAQRDKAINALRNHRALTDTINASAAIAALTALSKRLDQDILRLGKEDTSTAIVALELERQTLRHREVLSQLLPSIRTYVTDTKWCAKATAAKTLLNPRHITDKEKELSTKIIGDAYRTALASECKDLECLMPIELQTAGQKGKTVRSLAIKGGHQPTLILSEGEQKAVALADFLTEVALNPANAGIILDDPVTSQDHERKTLIAKRLVREARTRQVVIFTHDLPFLNQVILQAENQDVGYQAHWIDRTSDGRPGQVILNDVPAPSKAYDTAERAKHFLAIAKQSAGSACQIAIVNGMGALRRTIEETTAKRFLKNVVPRWQDRVIVTALPNINWDDALVQGLVSAYEDLSAYIEGHSHTDEAMGAPPEPKDLEKRIATVEALIKRSKVPHSIAKALPQPASILAG